MDALEPGPLVVPGGIGSAMEGRAGGTGGWANWETREAGIIEIRDGRNDRVRLTAFDTRGEEIVNLVHLELSPER